MGFDSVDVGELGGLETLILYSWVAHKWFLAASKLESQVAREH